MKRFTAIMAFSIILVSCSNQNDKKRNEKTEQTKQIVSEPVV